MAEMIKHTDGEVLYELRHLTRESPKPSRNKDIVPALSKNNEIIIGGPAAEAREKYNQRMGEIYHLNRSDLITGMHWCVGFPEDLAPGQEAAFVRAVVDFFPEFFGKGDENWKKNIIEVVVHRDEGVRKNGELIAGRPHIHILAIPVVKNKKYQKLTPTGRKPASYGYGEKCCIQELVNLRTLKKFHPALQAYLDDRGIRATVYHGGRTGDRNMSIDELKNLTKTTGYTVEEVRTMELEINNLREQIISRGEKDVSRGWGDTSGWGLGERSGEWNRNINI